MRDHHDVLCGMRFDDIVDGAAHSLDDARRRLLELELAFRAEVELYLDESGVFPHVLAQDSRGLDGPTLGARVDRRRADPSDTLVKAFRLPAPQSAQWRIGPFAHPLVAIAMAHKPYLGDAFDPDQKGGLERSHGLGHSRRSRCHG